MKFLMGILVAVLLTPALAIAGSTVYKCKDDKGAINFQDVPCANQGQTVSAATYNAPRVCGSKCGAQNGNDWAQNVAQPTDTSSEQQDQFASSPQQPSASQAPSGYQCDVGGRHWVQPRPCPATSTVTVPIVGMSGNDQFGNHFTNGTGYQVQQAPVTQQGLSHTDYCQKLKDHSATDKGRSSYERNKQETLNGC